MLVILQDFINQGNYDLMHIYKLYLKIDDEIKNNINIDNNIANIFIEMVIQSKFKQYEIIENIIKKFANANFNIDIFQLFHIDDKLYNKLYDKSLYPKLLVEDVKLNEEIVIGGLLIDIISKYYNIFEQCKNLYKSNKNKINVFSRYSNYIYYMFPTLYDKLSYKLSNDISLNNAFEFLIKSIVNNYIINNYHFDYKYINTILLFKKTQNANDENSLIIIDDKIFDALINYNDNDNINDNEKLNNMGLLIGTLIDIFNEHFIIDYNLKYDWKNIIARNIKNIIARNIKNNLNNGNIFEYIKYYSQFLRDKYYNIYDISYQVKNYPMRYTDSVNDYRDNRYDNKANYLLINDYPNIGWENIFRILSHFDANRKLDDFNDKFKLLYSSFNNNYNTLYDIIYEMLERNFDAQKGFECFIIFFSSMFNIEDNIDLFNDIVNLFIRYGAYILNINMILNNINIYFSSEYNNGRIENIYSFIYNYNDMFNSEYFSNDPNMFFHYDYPLSFFDNLGKIVDLLLPLQNLLEDDIIKNLKTTMNSNLQGLSNIIMNYVNIFKIDWENVPSFDDFCHEINLNPNDTFEDRINANLYDDFYQNKLKLVLIKQRSQYLQLMFPYYN